MKKLELKHIAPYLPYGLKGRVDKESYLQEERERIGELKTIDLADLYYELVVYGDLGYFLCDISDIKPILRPLSDLTKEISNGVGLFYPYEELHLCYSDVTNFLNEDLWIGQWWDYEKVSKLFEWHFDVFGLIEKGLAIDINTLNQEL